MNVGQKGSILYVNTGFNMSAYTALTLRLLPPTQQTKDVTPALGTVTTTVNGTTLNANEYVTYALQSTDLNVAGTWQLRVLYTDASQYIPSDWASFTVGP